MTDDETASGWDAIDAALRPLYPDIEPKHWAAVPSWQLGGQNPLDGVSAYPRTDPVPHWHLVSYGMSELYSKESDDAEESGWGFEFTMRVARRPDEDVPQTWPISVLQNLGRYVFTSGNTFAPGHTINVNGPINTSREDTVLRALAFTTDSELGVIDTPHGRLRFLQVVALALDEYEAARQWNTASMLELLQPHLPLFVTDLDRPSLLDNPEVASAAYAGVQRDGSSTGALYLGTGSFHRTEAGAVLHIGALQAPAVATTLRGRLPFGNDLYLESEEAVVCLTPGTEFAVAETDGLVTLTVSDAGVDELAAALDAGLGQTALATLPGLSVEVVPTQMRDAYGNPVDEGD